MRNIIAGPVFMDGPSLLFYSRNGYVLFGMTGGLLDSHSVFKDNRKLSATDPGRLTLAYPVDNKTLLYFQRNGDSVVIFEKKICRRGLFPVIGNAYANIKDIEIARLFNLANNVVMDETAPKSFLMPNLVGYSTLTNGKKWWTLDKFYSFMSPIICMQDQAFCSFYPGLLSDQKTDVQKSIINPLGVFSIDGRDYYYGVHSSTCSTEPESHQNLYLCDQAGNLLMTTQLLKQVTTDDVLEYDKKRNTNYTVKRPSQFVCQPAIDENGNIYYGVIDFDAKQFEVKKRLFYHYCPRIVEQSPQEEDYVNAQRRFTCKPASVPCKDPDKNVSTETGFTMRDEQGKLRKASMKDVSCKGFCVMVRREPIPDMKKRLSQSAILIPPNVKRVRDSLAKAPGTACPYNVTLYYDEREKVRVFYYGPGEEVLAARVLTVTPKSEIFVRVDLKDRAEIVAFTQDGLFLNRFTFNRQEFKKRRDIAAVLDDGAVMEEDYERIKEDYTYLKWELSTSIPPVMTAYYQKKK
jgi:hypothetical protein